MSPEKIWPDYYGDDAVPESEMHEANREYPSCEPKGSYKAVLFDKDVVHAHNCTLLSNS